jgi:hypothetical protein
VTPPEPVVSTVKLPDGFTLPVGMTPEMAAAFMAQLGQQQAPKKRGRPRTPPVSPEPTNSAQVTGLAGQQLPDPVSLPQSNVVPLPTTAPANDAAIKQLTETINKLI